MFVRGQACYDFAVEFARKYPSLFWDVDPAQLESERHATFIIERTLERGGVQAIRELFELYGAARIVAVIRSSRRISRRTALFWKSYLDITGPIRCLQSESRNPLSRQWE
ncbi:MAG TPA: hypothetical protein VNN62_17095 [Methylomirabilota bacterium]|nr:hypothetical protein [Methylomirabilota bacterium]